MTSLLLIQKKVTIITELISSVYSKHTRNEFYVQPDIFTSAVIYIIHLHFWNEGRALSVRTSFTGWNRHATLQICHLWCCLHWRCAINMIIKLVWFALFLFVTLSWKFIYFCCCHCCCLLLYLLLFSCFRFVSDCSSWFLVYFIWKIIVLFCE